MDTLQEMVSDHVHSWKKIGRLSITHLIKEYRGAVFGWAWAVIKPAVVIFVFWFAFTFGLRKGDDINGYSFFLWLISGFVPWFFMRDAMASGSSSIRKYRYLVQKINFPIDTIPTFVCLGELIVNIFLFMLMNLIFFIFGHGPDIYYLQIPLYYVMMFIFFDLFSIFLALIGSVSLDFLNLTPDGAKAVLGDPADEAWVADNGGWLHTLSWQGLSLTFLCDGEKRPLYAAGLFLEDDLLEGPRGLMPGASLSDVLSRFYRDPAAPEADGPVTELYRLEDGRRGELETPAEGLATVRYYCGTVMLRLYTEGGTLKNLTLQRTN